MVACFALTCWMTAARLNYHVISRFALGSSNGLLAPRQVFMMCSEDPQNRHMNTTKTLLAGAAVAGLMTGSAGMRTFAAGEPTPAGVLLQTMVEKHACKGQNSCRGQGGCQSGDRDVRAGTPARARAAAPLTRDSSLAFRQSGTTSPFTPSTERPQVGSLLMLAVTAVAFLLVTWIAPKDCSSSFKSPPYSERHGSKLL